mmetsp:Transcript_93504/g.242025  ORF Transcript_93504/g.242025 Transcript_93504/m.242025 type:complete len:675 (+) Transcript_93504:68-2092(+)
MDVVVVATFEDFDETLDKRLRGPGSGRKHASQALLQYLCEQAAENVSKVELLILDWKNPPKGAAKEVKVSLRRGVEKLGHWGSRDQLMTKFPSSVWDVAICTQTRRFVLDFTGQLKVRRRAAMVHSYDLPLGPWGQEQTDEQLKEHAEICEKFELLCASQHLTDFVEKWGEGRFSARCVYAADYGYFDPAPEAPLCPWEERHGHVTFVSPCPEKGLALFAGLAQSMPEAQFLAVKTVAWTKPWHEQMLKKFQNVKVQPATDSIDAILRLTRVLIVPSVHQEAFGLLVTEAQLRGIPVVSSGACGLREANRVASSVVQGVPIVYDQRTRELITGMTMEEAESSLAPDRAGGLTMEQWRQTAINQENYQKVADENDVELFRAPLRTLLDGGEGALRQASQDARLAASSFVDSRRGQFLSLLQRLMQEHKAAGDAKPAPAITGGAAAAPKFAPKARVRGEHEVEDYDFDVNQDFTKAEDFDGLALASRCLVRLCEAGNLTVAAELIQAKADVNMPEPDVGVTPLIGAANAGHLDLCKYLFRKEADVNGLVRDGTERTALHAASQMGFASVVQLLLERRANPKVEDLTKTTPLILAVRYGHAGATDLLLKHKANPNQSDDQGQVAINDAVAKDRFDLVTKLLEHGALVNVRNMAGLEAISFSRTPQMQSIIMKHDVNF